MRLSLLLAFILPFAVSASLQEQIIIPPMPQTIASPFTSSQPTLADLLTIEPSASIYYSYARETELSSRFSSESVWFTMLVPTNKAVMALAHKPHQGPEPVEPRIGISEQELDESSKRNVERWVSAHIIPSRISLSDIPVSYETLQDGKLVTFNPVSNTRPDSPEWMRVTLEDGVRIIGMKEAQNGVLYLIDGTVVPN
ncbi:uncharacterized protein F5891DRAFT_1022841 [Suillus fuscotomentosus]|uniref:FAS1 domain-containing protein n=1 Tax=Suillus fuscotomentosus TaxID=1912939 RepID=A0AAD4EB19_9AGAM|nr:uncharacterized protein F5891DRAFT_1022841 [Suillus fuscotomentosus]KAG1902672.1 hypothetical protein F5891DRAFT_1022841 [Suillus fuscotomentosus]